MDVGLGQAPCRKIQSSTQRLNPCFSGCWSRTAPEGCKEGCEGVLILVLVDVGLGQSSLPLADDDIGAVLILVLVDVGLGRRYEYNN